MITSGDSISFACGGRIIAKNFRVNSLVPPEEPFTIKYVTPDFVSGECQRLECVTDKGLVLWCYSFEVKNYIA